MGKIRISKIELITTMSEMVGYKAGIALDRPGVVKFLEGEEDLSGEDDELMIVRSEEFESMLHNLLYRVGNTPRRAVGFPTITIYHRYRNDPNLFPIADAVMSSFPDLL